GRVTAVMPCGTGKTLVSLWIAEQLQSEKILVLVPSLALMRQTLHEWMKETQWDKVSILSVCSDPTVQKQNDDWMVEQCDLDFPVTTDSHVVNQFLRQETDATKIVFSTYQSSPVVADGMGGTDSFDFAIFDEAHKTAGRQGTKFSFALTDDNLSIQKRLFMTATPRHYNVSKKNKEGEHQLVYSMDVPETYGNLVHQLSFAKAIEQDIICDYKVVISVVTSSEVNDQILSQGEVLIEGDLVRAKQVANQIALQRVVEKYQTGKIITFHSVVRSAKSFVSQGSEGIAYHLPDFDCDHVNGTMSTSEREQIMKKFRSANESIISNARCLTEGVDVPTVDMVCFMSPKKSKVDIVQATGRAMRKSEGKDYGYTLIPLFLELKVGESIEEALERTDFGEVWNVLQALKEQDEVLVDIIAQMRVDKGRTKGFDDSRFREKVEVLGAEIDLETLREVITTRLIERLGLSWDEMYGQLIAYREEFGHCNVPQRYPDNPQL
ncbi:TPA: DEAD/DEAH box helicase, partial [Candidatus Poribacteria bacterium]|nr:DEAD/DEAH box helicase [Candidatus Poribacteria bacterium]